MLDWRVRQETLEPHRMDCLGSKVRKEKRVPRSWETRGC